MSFHHCVKERHYNRALNHFVTDVYGFVNEIYDDIPKHYLRNFSHISDLIIYYLTAKINNVDLTRPVEDEYSNHVQILFDKITKDPKDALITLHVYTSNIYVYFQKKLLFHESSNEYKLVHILRELANLLKLSGKLHKLIDEFRPPPPPDDPDDNNVLIDENIHEEPVVSDCGNPFCTYIRNQELKLRNSYIRVITGLRKKTKFLEESNYKKKRSHIDSTDELETLRNEIIKQSNELNDSQKQNEKLQSEIIRSKTLLDEAITSEETLRKTLKQEMEGAQLESERWEISKKHFRETKYKDDECITSLRVQLLESEKSNAKYIQNQLAIDKLTAQHTFQVERLNSSHKESEQIWSTLRTDLETKLFQKVITSVDPTQTKHVELCNNTVRLLGVIDIQGLFNWVESIHQSCSHYLSHFQVSLKEQVDNMIMFFNNIYPLLSYTIEENKLTYISASTVVAKKVFSAITKIRLDSKSIDFETNVSRIKELTDVLQLDTFAKMETFTSNLKSLCLGTVYVSDGIIQVLQLLKTFIVTTDVITEVRNFTSKLNSNNVTSFTQCVESIETYRKLILIEGESSLKGFVAFLETKAITFSTYKLIYEASERVCDDILNVKLDKDFHTNYLKGKADCATMETEYDSTLALFTGVKAIFERYAQSKVTIRQSHLFFQSKTMTTFVEYLKGKEINNVTELITIVDEHVTISSMIKSALTVEIIQATGPFVEQNMDVELNVEKMKPTYPNVEQNMDVEIMKPTDIVDACTCFISIFKALNAYSVDDLQPCESMNQTYGIITRLLKCQRVVSDLLTIAAVKSEDYYKDDKNAISKVEKALRWATIGNSVLFDKTHYAMYVGKTEHIAEDLLKYSDSLFSGQIPSKHTYNNQSFISTNDSISGLMEAFSTTEQKVLFEKVTSQKDTMDIIVKTLGTTNVIFEMNILKNSRETLTLHNTAYVNEITRKETELTSIRESLKHHKYVNIDVALTDISAFRKYGPSIVELETAHSPKCTPDTIKLCFNFVIQMLGEFKIISDIITDKILGQLWIYKNIDVKAQFIEIKRMLEKIDGSSYVDLVGLLRNTWNLLLEVEVSKRGNEFDNHVKAYVDNYCKPLIAVLDSQKLLAGHLVTDVSNFPDQMERLVDRVRQLLNEFQKQSNELYYNQIKYLLNLAGTTNVLPNVDPAFDQNESYLDQYKSYISLLLRDYESVDEKTFIEIEFDKCLNKFYKVLTKNTNMDVFGPFMKKIVELVSTYDSLAGRRKRRRMLYDVYDNLQPQIGFAPEIPIQPFAVSQEIVPIKPPVVVENIFHE